MKKLILGLVVCYGLMSQSQPQVLQNGWLSGNTTPSSCNTGSSPDFYNSGSKILFHCVENKYVLKTIQSSIVDSPDSLSATLIVSPGNVENGRHIYFASFITDKAFSDSFNGETYPAETGITITDKTRAGQVRLTLPISSDSRVIGRRIYRTKADAFTTNDDIYLLTTITDNTTTSYVDNISDTSLSTIVRLVSPYFNNWNSTGTTLVGVGDGTNKLVATIGDGSLLIQKFTLDISRIPQSTGVYTVYLSNTFGDSLAIASVVNHVTDLLFCSIGREGLRSGVQDATAPTALAPVVGGGSVHVGVYCDGTNWIVQ